MPLLGIGEVVGDDGQFGHTAYFFGKTETQQRPWLDDILFVQVRLCAVHDARLVRIVGIGWAPCRVVALLVVVSHGVDYQVILVFVRLEIVAAVSVLVFVDGLGAFVPYDLYRCGEYHFDGRDVGDEPERGIEPVSQVPSARREHAYVVERRIDIVQGHVLIFALDMEPCPADVQRCVQGLDFTEVQPVLDAVLVRRRAVGRPAPGIHLDGLRP